MSRQSLVNLVMTLRFIINGDLSLSPSASIQMTFHGLGIYTKQGFKWNRIALLCFSKVLEWKNRQDCQMSAFVPTILLHDCCYYSIYERAISDSVRFGQIRCPVESFFLFIIHGHTKSYLTGYSTSISSPGYL